MTQNLCFAGELPRAHAYQFPGQIDSFESFDKKPIGTIIMVRVTNFPPFLSYPSYLLDCHCSTQLR